jgi:predicted dehydrogenase
MPHYATGDSVRIAMVGAGGMANNVHYPSLASFADVEIAAICDLDPVRLNATADKYSVTKRYANYRQMIEEVVPDGVYVIGQPHLMYDIWKWCLEQGLNLYIEKPMGITTHQARMLAWLAEQHDCITQVSFQRRSCPMVTKLHAQCLERGPMVHAICKFYKCQPTPYAEARDHMMDDCVHSIDTVRWMCGGEVIDIESECKRIGTPDINFILATLRFDNGSTGVVINSWSSGKRIFAVEMHAPGIFIEAEHEGKGLVYTDGNLTPTVYDTREVAGSDQNYVYGGFQAKNREFIDALKGGPLPSSHFGDAIKTMQVAEIILAQALFED